jgi:hypothetical protein
MRFPPIPPLATAALLAVVLALPVADAATITVNDLSDYDSGSGPSNSASDSTGCTLRKAIANANANAQTFTDCAAGSGSSNTIVIQGSGTIKIGSYGSPIFINRTLAINGGVTIDGDKRGDIFRVGVGGVELTLNGLTLKNGSNSAVSIFSSSSSLVVNACGFEDNTNPGSGGGAINSSGPVQVNACAFEGNSATGSSDGGGAIRISGSGASSITNSLFVSNSAKTSGGAVRYIGSGNTAALTISNTTFLNNSAKADGGKAQGGGALWLQNGLLTLQNSLFGHNEVEGEGRGGALHLALGSPLAVLDNNLFTLNKASGNDGMGGAIFSARAALVRGNSFIGNSADNGRGGAIAANAPLKGSYDANAPGFMLVNSTLHDNSAKRGGAIYTFGPESGGVARGLTLVNVTIDGNSAADAGGGGGIYAAEIQPGKAPETDLRNSILSNNSANGSPDNCNSNPAIAVLANGGNLRWPAGGACAASSAIAVGDPKLAGPALDGPPPGLTMAPQAGSFALQAGVAGTCSGFPVFNLDQRLATRPSPSGSSCDAGAFESSLGPPAPALDAKPDAGLAFGSVALTQTAQLTATVSNPGTLVLEGLSLAVSGTGFSLQASGCGASLAVGASCSATVQFAPTVAQAASGTFTATGTGGLVDTVALSGTGFQPAPGVQLLPAAGLAFGEQPVDTASAQLQATVKNSGNQQLTGLAFSASGPFTVETGTCGSTLAVGAECVVNARFAPVAPGAANGTLIASSSAGAGDSIVLSGSGTTPANLVIGPPVLAFGSQRIGTTSDRMFATVSNPGTQTASNLIFTGASNIVPFVVTANGCGSQLAGGQQCTVELRFAPTATGAVQRTFGLAAMGIAFKSIELTGSGFDPPQLRVAPAEGLDFARIQTGTTSNWMPAQVVNDGGEPLTGLQVAPSPPFHLLFSTCGATLAAGASCSMRVVVTPLLDGAVTGSLAATADGGLAGQITLRAQGFTPASLVLQPVVGLQFGSHPVGSTADVRQAVVSNPGSDTAFALGFSSGARFPITGHTCGSTLAGGASCTLSVGFEPDSAMDFTASLVVNGIRGFFTPISANVALSGSGYAQTPRLRLTPSAGLDFGAVEIGAASAMQTATLSNLLLTNSASFSLSTSGNDFVLDAGNCVSPLAVGASCTLHLFFTPGGPAGAVVGFVQASNSGQDERIDLRGRAIAVGSAAFAATPAAPGPLAFATRGGAPVARSVSIANLGSALLSVGQPALGGSHPGDFLVATQMPIEIAAGAPSKSLLVTCVPTGAGRRSALLTLQTNDPQQASVSFGLNCENAVPFFQDGFEPEPGATF